jgi:hypothetical protein
MHLTLTLLLSLTAGFASTRADAAGATLTAVGDLDRLAIGQAGFCGDRNEVGPGDWGKVALRGDEQAWFFANSTYRTPSGTYKCSIERTFIPASGKSYILRVTHEPKNCRVELFRVVPGENPAREKLMQPEGKSCLAQ